MINFTQYIAEKNVVGLIEFFNIDGIGKVAAKLDSGNGAYNVLHGEDIQEQGDKVFFRTVNGRTLLRPKVGEITINVGAGNTEHRPVVELDFTIGDQEFLKVPFSIGNRSSNLYKILVGKDFIQNDLDAFIDVGAENIASKNITADINESLKALLEGKFYNDTLHERFWKNDKFDEEVRDALVELAEIVSEGADIPLDMIQDIQLTGSMSNYNYTEYSDLDVHILLDFKDLNPDEDLVRKALDGKRFVWNMRHDIKIGGHDVEVYFQDVDDPHTASGLYSLKHNKWITEPTHNPPQVDERDVTAKADQFKGRIDDLEASANKVNSAEELTELQDAAQSLRDKLSTMRKDSLAQDGEFGIGNLAFKELRNSEYIGRLIDVATKLFDDQYTTD